MLPFDTKGAATGSVLISFALNVSSVLASLAVIEFEVFLSAGLIVTTVLCGSAVALSVKLFDKNVLFASF